MVQPIQMSVHEILVKRAKEAIREVFNDTSVSRSATRESLEILDEEISENLSTLRDIIREEDR